MASDRPARSATPVIHPRITTNKFIYDLSKDWDVKMLASLVAQEDIPHIYNLFIS